MEGKLISLFAPYDLLNLLQSLKIEGKCPHFRKSLLHADVKMMFFCCSWKISSSLWSTHLPRLPPDQGWPLPQLPGQSFHSSLARGYTCTCISSLFLLVASFPLYLRSIQFPLPHGPTPLNKLRDPEPRPSLQKVLCLPGVPFSPYLPVDFLPTHPQRPISTSASSKKLPASFPLFSHSILNLRYDLSQFYA